MQVKPISGSIETKQTTGSEFSEKLTLATNKLYDQKKSNEGFLTCGMGTIDNEECIYLYVKDQKTKLEMQELEKNGFEGFKVLVKVSGQVEFA